jgi:hypothetical protein
MNNERIVFLNSLHLKKNLLNKYLKLLEIDNKKILNLEYHHKIRQVINSFIFDIIPNTIKNCTKYKNA